MTYFGRVAETRTRGDAARAAIVASAERLFAERGIEGVSLRDVSATANQRNHSAAQYHFGGRQGLVAAVYEARMVEVDERRQARLEALREEGRTGDLEALVEAIVVPLVDVVAESDGWYGRFLARTRWEPAAWRAILDLPVSGGFATVLSAIDRELKDVHRPAIRRHRIDQLMTLVIGTVAGWEGAPDRGERRLPSGVLAAELVVTGTALLCASPTTAGRLPVPTQGASA